MSLAAGVLGVVSGVEVSLPLLEADFSCLLRPRGPEAGAGVRWIALWYRLGTACELPQGPLAALARTVTVACSLDVPGRPLGIEMAVV